MKLAEKKEFEDLTKLYFKVILSSGLDDLTSILQNDFKTMDPKFVSGAFYTAVLNTFCQTLVGNAAKVSAKERRQFIKNVTEDFVETMKFSMQRFELEEETV